MLDAIRIIAKKVDGDVDARFAEHRLRRLKAIRIAADALGITGEKPDPIPTWGEYNLGFALHAATKSKDSTKVGAALIGPDGEVRLTGYNGPPKGVRDLPERFERPAKYMFTSHAEMNLVAFAAREGIRTKGCAVYVTHACCSICARLLIQAGVSSVVYGDGTTSMPSEEFEAAKTMFREAGVNVSMMPASVQ